MIKKLAFLLGVMAAVAFTSSPAMAQRHHGDHGRGHGHSGVSINLGVHGPVYGYGGYRYRDPYYGYYAGRRYYRDRSYYHDDRSEEHTSELQSLIRNSYAGFCLKKKNTH